MRESSKARAALDAYLALGPERSLAKLQEQNRHQSAIKAPSETTRLKTLAEWSRQHRWQERARQHDDEQRRLERERRDAQDREQADLRRKHRLGVAVMERSLAVAALQLKAQQDRISAYAAVQLLQHADACERLDYGEVTSRTAIHGSAAEPIRFTIAIDHGGREHPSESPGASGWGAIVSKPDGLERNPS